MRNLLYVLRIAGILLLICGVMTGLLAAVNAKTADVIAENKRAKLEETVRSFFGEKASSAETDAFPLTGEVSGVRLVSVDGSNAGYAVSVTEKGFGGEITMLVGVTLDGKVKGVALLSHSETPGLGARAGEEPFLSQFAGRSGKLAVKENVDAVSGATISSKAVTAGVNAALAAIRGEGAQ